MCVSCSRLHSFIVSYAHYHCKHEATRILNGNRVPHFYIACKIKKVIKWHLR